MDYVPARPGRQRPGVQGLRRRRPGLRPLTVRTYAENTGFPEAVDFDRERTRAEEGLALLVQRAKDAGKLREDFDPSDITLLMLANSGIVGDSPQVSAAASRRLVGYLLQSFRAGHAAPLPPTAPLELHQFHGAQPGR